MFLRKLGNQCYILHSFRDGMGKVRHRRFGQWRGADGVRLALESWEEWKEEVRSHCPELKVDWTDLKAQAERIEQQLRVSRRTECQGPEALLKRSLQKLLRQIEQLDDPAAMRMVRGQVTQAVRRRLEWCGELGPDEDGAKKESSSVTDRLGTEIQADRSIRCVQGRPAERPSALVGEEPKEWDAGLSGEGSDEGHGGLSGHGGDAEQKSGLIGEEPDEYHSGLGGQEVPEDCYAGVGASAGGTYPEDEDEGDWEFSAPPSREEEPSPVEALHFQLQEMERALGSGELSLAEQLGRAAVQQSRDALPGRRRRFESLEEAGSLYLRALELLAEVRRQQGLLDEACRLARTRAEARPDADALYGYGASLQRCGRHEEALDPYGRAPYRAAWRFYLSAAAACQSGRREEGIDLLLAGMTRDRSIFEEWQKLTAGKPVSRPTGFWDRFGDVWSPESLAVMVAVGENRAVRGRVAACKKDGVLPRTLFFPHGRRILSLWVQAALEGRRFCFVTNSVVELDAPRPKLPRSG